MGHNWKKIAKKVWHFIWEEDSIWSWIVNVVLAFVLIKFIVYPGLGFLLGTTHPIVAVVSGSMEHDGRFEDWWVVQYEYYRDYNISKDKFLSFSFKNGFNKGDIMILVGQNPKNIKEGNVIVFNGGRKDPIIHRVIKRWEEDGKAYFQTKGDHNPQSMQGLEMRIPESQVIGKALFRIPLLGYIKIWFVDLLRLLHLVG
jgi:signal peptidase I